MKNNNNENFEQIDNSKRNLLKWLWALSAAAILWVTTEVEAKTEKILKTSSIEKSTANIWKIEVKHFKKIFNLNSEKDFYNKVLEIQSTWKNLPKNWVIDWKTLSYIYRNFYSKISNLPLELKTRLEVFKVFSQYAEKNKNYKVSWLLSAFDKWYFYWQGLWVNYEWTYFSEDLIKDLKKYKIDYLINWNSNLIKVEKLPNWKYYLLMYVSWTLQVATYVSPGTNSNRTPQNRTDKIDFLTKYKVSNSYPKRESGWNWWAAMPFSFEMNAANWIYWHVWSVNWRWRSHWCVRVPAYYQYGIYNLLEKNWSKNFDVKVWKLY